MCLGINGFGQKPPRTSREYGTEGFQLGPRFSPTLFFEKIIFLYRTVDDKISSLTPRVYTLTHFCPPLRSTFAVRETASLGIMGETRVPPLNPSELIML